MPMAGQSPAEAAATAERQTRALRRDALRARPRSGVELMHAARALHVDLIAQPALAFLAELASGAVHRSGNTPATER